MAGRPQPARHGRAKRICQPVHRSAGETGLKNHHYQPEGGMSTRRPASGSVDCTIWTNTGVFFISMMIGAEFVRKEDMAAQYPAGGSLHTRAIRWTSAFPSSLVSYCWLDGLPCKATSKPSSLCKSLRFLFVALRNFFLLNS